MRGLESVHESLETACSEKIVATERLYTEVLGETRQSENMLDQASREEQETRQVLDEAQQKLESAENALNVATSALSACQAQPSDESGQGPDCSNEETALSEAQNTVNMAQKDIEEAKAKNERSIENRQRMGQRLEYAKQALSMAEQGFESTQWECTMRMREVDNFIDTGKLRLSNAQHALNAYLAANPSASRFHKWLNWSPEQSKPITPDVMRNRLNLSREQQGMLQDYLYDRNAGYRNIVDKYRGEWANAKGDVERNIVSRKVRIHLCGTYAEHLAQHALSPLGGKVETQGQTLVGDNGRYTKTDLIVTDLQVPVILGRGKGMMAPIGGSLAFEVKSGKADYLYAQKDHMVFQSEGHKEADAHCTLCSRDIHDLSPEKENELRNALREAGSPLVGLLPAKKDIDQLCLKFIQSEKKEDTQ